MQVKISVWLRGGVEAAILRGRGLMHRSANFQTAPNAVDLL